MISNTIAKYKILRLIGDGGMASVYAAEHELLGTKAAVKVLKPELSMNPQIRDRFRNEARHMALLTHPNIAKVIDFDEQPQQLSIIMELLEGEDLGYRIKRSGPISESELSYIFRKVLSALQYAHEKGVVHRDIKPSNIFLTSDGQVKLLDFGIAKVYGQSNELTHTGQLMGTPVYMSPEQVRGEKMIDHRTDIYSLGVTMYFAVTGTPPYDASIESQFNIYNKIVHEPIPRLKGQPIIDHLIQGACAKDRSQRFQNCGEFLFHLSNLSNIDDQRDHSVLSNGSLSSFDQVTSDPQGIHLGTLTSNTDRTSIDTDMPYGEVNVVGSPGLSNSSEGNKNFASILRWLMFSLIFVVLSLALVVYFNNNNSDEVASANAGPRIEDYIPAKPVPPRLVVDLTGTLDPEQVQAMENKLVDYYNTTSNQLAVVIIPSTGTFDISDVAVQLGRKWGVGTKELNNGIVFLIAKNDNAAFIATGYGFDNMLADSTVKNILQNKVFPYFRANDYYRGIDEGIRDLIIAIH